MNTKFYFSLTALFLVGISSHLHAETTPADHEVLSAELYSVDPTTAAGKDAESVGTLTMNENAKNAVSSFTLTRQVRPTCSPGEMCPDFIALVITDFEVFDTLRTGCSTIYFGRTATSTPVATTAPTLAGGTTPASLEVVDFRDASCERASETGTEWLVRFQQGTTRATYYGEPEPAN